jgi:transcriptional regulator with GAF, ATPase, and Fis domain
MPPISSSVRSQPPVQRGWTLLIGISVASTLGLAAAVLPLLEQHVDSAWPWANTQRILLLAFPLTVIAAIFYLSDQQRRAQAVHRELMRQRERATERAERQNARLSALLNVSRIMGTEIRLQSVFDSVTEICREAFACDRVSLMLVDSNAQELVVRSASGHDDPSGIVGTRQKIGEGVAGHVAAKGKPVVLGSETLDPKVYQGLRKPRRSLEAAIVVPIQVRDEMVGVLNIASEKPGSSYDEEDLRALQVFAENVGSCIRHAEQAEWMRQIIQRHTAGAAEGSSSTMERSVPTA